MYNIENYFIYGVSVKKEYLNQCRNIVRKSYKELKEELLKTIRWMEIDRDNYWFRTNWRKCDEAWLSLIVFVFWLYFLVDGCDFCLILLLNWMNMTLDLFSKTIYKRKIKFIFILKLTFRHKWYNLNNNNPKPQITSEFQNQKM